MALLEDDLEDDLLEMESAAHNEPCRQRWVWVVYALLFASSVSWYLPGHAQTLIWFGLPAWVVLSLAITLGIALFTVFVIREYWQEEEEQDGRRISNAE